ncbi:hypothetical protein [Limoniibacter endophyticus]|uniref:Uncharacterized protein n=1 Tax=Limoniibacter endophyticus TaxID=1565040 RepID=A0A8J3DPA7_9HYPH|nr:hypothetical protein [Limoniibacter endophyticus]GHC73609.1 hypothetical protein GCM10010136_21850 [Limoniibacter endophyticus]
MFSVRKLIGPGRLKPIAGLIMAVGFTVALVSGLLPGADPASSGHSIAGGPVHQASFTPQGE